MSDNEVYQKWVRTTIPVQCHDNAVYAARVHGLTMVELYRYILTFFLWGDDPEIIVNSLAEMRGLALVEQERKQDDGS